MKSLEGELNAVVDSACERFTEALGWPLRFGSESDFTNAPRKSGELIAEVHDGKTSRGFLRLDQPESTAAACHYAAACQLSRVLADLCTRLAQSEQALTDRGLVIDQLLQTESLETAAAIAPHRTLAAIEQFLFAAVGLAEAWAGSFVMLDLVGNALKLRASVHLPARAVPQYHELLPIERELLQLAEVCEIRQEDVSKSLVLPMGARSALVAPVRTAVGTVGLIFCYERRQNPFSAAAYRSLSAVAGQVGKLLDREVLVAENSRQRRLSDEVHVASSRLSACIVSPLVNNTGLDVAIKSLSASELGGDLCDVFPVGPKQVAFACGDAVGHGVSAAMVMSVVRGAFRALVASDPQRLRHPELVLEQINATLQGVTRSEQFMTLVAGNIDVEARTLEFSNAGHPYPILLRSGVCQPLSTHGIVLGVLSQATYQRQKIELIPGDILCLFTDGVSEATDHRNELFRSNGIETALEAQAIETAEQAVAAVWDALLQHLDGRQPADDMTLLALKIN
jgi:phosphoserine phosphatase RsbU/P